MSHKQELFGLINQFFDQVFVITLKKSTDRHEILQNKLSGLDYEIFWGINGAELDLNQLEKEGKLDKNINYQSKGHHLAPGEVGCALSHVGIYQTILDRNLKNALILEDDLMIDADNANSSETLRKSFHELPENWELLYLGYANNNNRINFQAHLRTWIVYPLLYVFNRSRFNPLKYRRRFPRKFSENLQRAGFHYRTHAYGISNSGARKVLQYQTPVGLAADNAVSEMCTLNAIRAFRVKNCIFYQNRDLDTTIHSRYLDDDKSPHKH